jgi:hypothetical protein
MTTAQKLRSGQAGSRARISMGRIGPDQAMSTLPESRLSAALLGSPAVSRVTSTPWRR